MTIIILLSKEIDLILVPSAWVERSWVASGFKLIDKIKVWPAGIADAGIDGPSVDTSNKRRKIILYKKNISENVYLTVKEVLEELKLEYEEIVYGKYLNRDYLNKLDESYLLIYLQQSESQGISLLEAWMKNIPIFVYNSNSYKIKDVSISGSDIAAPYLNSLSGDLFNSKESLMELIDNLLKGKSKYEPRKYYLSEFTDSICAEKLIEIIES